MGQRDMGKYVPPGNRVAGNRLKVWGASEIRFESINELVFHLYFLDERGEVINIHNFYSYLDHSDFIELTLEKRQIHRDFTIPPGAVAFAIGYDGETGRMPGEDAVSFSHNPFH